MTDTALVADPCAIGRVLALIGGKWKGPIIYWLREEPRRFSELRRLIPTVSSRVLTVQLRQLENEGVVCHDMADDENGRLVYSLTPIGEALIPLLDEIRDWARTHLVPHH